MIYDAQDAEEGELPPADICIVGAGAAGIAMALQFLNSRVDILILESGGLAPEPRTQALYQGTVTDARLHSPPDRYRERRFGGTTTIWGGRCMPFNPIDFEPRPYVPDSGWPITYDSVAAFYPGANRLCEAGEFVYDAGAALPGLDRPMVEGFEGEYFSSDTLER